MVLEGLLSDLPTTSPAMKTQHTAQAAHSCLCACSLSGVRPGCGRGSLWQWWKDISTGLGSSGRGSEGSVKRLRQAAQFKLGPGSRANLLLTPSPGSPRLASSDVPPLYPFPRPCGQRATGEVGLNGQLRFQPPFSFHVQSHGISELTWKAP